MTISRQKHGSAGDKANFVMLRLSCGSDLPLSCLLLCSVSKDSIWDLKAIFSGRFL